jgi:DNA-binding transcriptional ArsR family regulator
MSITNRRRLGDPGSPPLRDATAAEMRALAHPLRWRILRVTLDAPLTNKQIAERLGRDPGTVLHHVRMLVRGGYLAADPVRSGKRGALERPYRATRKSWAVRLTPASDDSLAMHDAVREEIQETTEDATLASLRLAVRLVPADVAELRERVRDLGTEFAARDDPAGEPVGIYTIVHRRRP